MDRRTSLTMNWDGLEETNYEDDLFFDTNGRISSAYPLDFNGLRSVGDDEISDSRLSFASCLSSASAFLPIAGAGAASCRNNSYNNNQDQSSAPRISLSMLQDYGVWIAEPPTDITERRRRLLQGMGLMSRRVVSNINLISDAGTRKSPSSSSTTTTTSNPDDSNNNNNNQMVASTSSSTAATPPSPIIFLVRSRSDGDIEFNSADAKKRKEELIGPVSKQRITRTSSVLMATNSALSHHHYANYVRRILSGKEKDRKSVSSMLSSTSSAQYRGGSIFLIKDLDSGKEFVVKESNENGSWNYLSDLETGKQLTMEEFEKCVGYSPVVNQLMRRDSIVPINLRHFRTKQQQQQQRRQEHHHHKQPPSPTNSYISKSFRYSKKRGAALLKSIKEAANTLINVDNYKERDEYDNDNDNDNDHDHDHDRSSFSGSQQWVKVRHHGKSQKDLTALYSCQQIQAHQGSIWTIKFSSDARYLASAGEDKVIRVWEVQEYEILSTDHDGAGYNHDHNHHHHQSPVAEISPMPYSDKRKMWRSFSNKKKRYSNSMPDYVNLPETVFALSETPVYTFEGHLEDVLDLSWSRQHLLLSSSMDKTVRLWDLETETCLRFFPHNDYVTCIQFNPADEDYFISGSLDSKVRIWDIKHRQVIAWIDLHEMVTAAAYTPDGQSAIVGTCKGTCRVYKLDDCRLELKDVIELKKKKKSHLRKITGIQCSSCYPDEALITSADSRIRIFDGSENTHKIKGLKNLGSDHISASYTPEGKFVVCASENNHVFMWEREEQKMFGGGSDGGDGGNGSGCGSHRSKGRTRIVTNGYEQFQCRDVSVAIPWPGSIKHESPLVELRSKRHSKRNSYSPRSCSRGSRSSIDIRDDDHRNHKRSNKRQQSRPPIPHVKGTLKRLLSFPDPDLPQYSSSSPRIDAGINGDSSLSSSMVYGGSDSDESPSAYRGDSNSHHHLMIQDGQRSSSSSIMSPSSSLLSLFDGHGIHSQSSIVHANAWGLVIVTATLGGEIRVYQNFGLPFKVSRRPIPS